ncbi:MAG: hypothetical protein V8S81_08810 [Oscillospiraceae bacterium]
MNESSGIFSAQISGKDLQAEDYRQIHRGLLLWAYTRYIAYWHNKWSVSLPIRSINYCVFPSHRVRGPQAANKIKSVFYGGVYVAKTPCAERVCFARLQRAKRAVRSETPSSKKSTALF